eukprot:scaffold5096_cov169-Amphora_coffeaeformis.AAC.5
MKSKQSFSNLVRVLLLAHCLDYVGAFVSRNPSVLPTASKTTSTSLLAKEKPTAAKKSGSNEKRAPSKVVDPEGPTPVMDASDIEEIDPEDVPELRDIENAADLPRPIPHQPWRRGDTAGCDAPIAVEWRQKAEEIVTKSVDLVGGKVLDVTWYLTHMVVTLDDDVMPPKDFGKAGGPVINIVEPRPAVFKDPLDPDPDEIWADEDDTLYQRETEEEAADAAQKEKNMYATKDAEDPVDEPHNPDKTEFDDIPLFLNEETRDDMAVSIAEQERNRYQASEQPMDIGNVNIDTAGLSTIAKAILDALEDYEDELHILKRHELVLTSPGPPDVVETQRQFDAYRGSNVIVETQDPFDSNRILKGKLVDRNAMDVMINKRGRLVTIPLNFVKCVRLPREKAKEVDLAP